MASFRDTGPTNLPTHAELLTQWSYPLYRLQRQPTPQKMVEGDGAKFLRIWTIFICFFSSIWQNKTLCIVFNLFYFWSNFLYQFEIRLCRVMFICLSRIYIFFTFTISPSVSSITISVPCSIIFSVTSYVILGFFLLFFVQSFCS